MLVLNDNTFINLIISGTNRNRSNSLKVARFYQKQLEKKGAEFDILSLEDLPANIAQTDLYGNRSEDFALIQEKISAAKLFVFIIPEYNGSYPGILKLFIDRSEERRVGKECRSRGWREN